MTTIERIDMSSGGTWVITTASGSRYILDLDARTCIRAATGEPMDEQLAGRWFVSEQLRRDGETLPLLGLVDPPVQVGRPAYFVLGGLSEEPGYLSTTRATTPVVSITRLDPSSS